MKIAQEQAAQLAAEAEAILSEYRAWADAKHASPTFDPVNRRYKLIEEKAHRLIESIRDAKEAATENIFERVAELLSENVPSYANLNAAYDLVTGRGFASDFVRRTLLSKPDDDEARISVAEEIEDFLSILAR